MPGLDNVFVVYLYQYLGAAHSKCWTKWSILGALREHFWSVFIAIWEGEKAILRADALSQKTKIS